MTQTASPAPALASTPAAGWRRYLSWPTLAAGLVLLAYAVYLIVGFHPAVTDPDDNGYFAQGSLIAQTGSTTFTEQSDAQYIGMHWLLTPNGTFISRYPPGLAVVIAGVYTVFGYQAATAVNPVLAFLTLVGFYLVARRLLPAGWAALALLILALDGTLAQHALSGDAHVGVAFCLVWGLVALLAWSARPRLWLAFLAGLVLGCIPTIRYPDALLGLGVVVFLAWHIRRVPGIWKHLALAALGAALPLGALLLRNQLVLGAFWRTGYSLTNEETGFAWHYFTEHALQYIETLCSTGLGPIFLLALLGIAWMICLRTYRMLGVTLAVMVVPIVLLYMSYYWAPRMNGATMRFLLPEFPLLILAGVWALYHAVGRTPRRLQIVSAGILLGIQAALSVPALGNPLQRGATDKVPVAEVTAALARTVPAGSVVVADQQSLLQYLDYVRQWKLADLSLVTGQPRGRMRNADPSDPQPMQAAKMLDLADKYTGTLDERETKYAHDLTAWSGGRAIYYVGPAERLSALRANPLTKDLTVVRTVALPDRPEPWRGRGSFRRGNFAGGPMGGPGGGPGMGAPMGGPPMMGGPGGQPGAGPMANGPRFAAGGPPSFMGRLTGNIVIARWTLADAVAQAN